VSDVNLAGVTMVGKTSYTDLTRTDITQLTAGLIGEKVPTTIAIHLKVENPNSVVARMVNLGWAFYFENTKVQNGRLEKVYEVGAGQTVDVVVPVTFNASDLNNRNTQDLFYMGLALVGVEGYTKTVSVDLSPSVETERGLIPFTEPIKASRNAVGS
jgi:LEA14-like dessication related protein